MKWKLKSALLDLYISLNSTTTFYTISVIVCLYTEKEQTIAKWCYKQIWALKKSSDIVDSSGFPTTKKVLHTNEVAVVSISIVSRYDNRWFGRILHVKFVIASKFRTPFCLRFDGIITKHGAKVREMENQISSPSDILQHPFWSLQNQSDLVYDLNLLPHPQNPWATRN